MDKNNSGHGYTTAIKEVTRTKKINFKWGK